MVLTDSFPRKTFATNIHPCYYLYICVWVVGSDAEVSDGIFFLPPEYLSF